eukprot:12526620-Ditylum_brightwellii.AAC.1
MWCTHTNCLSKADFATRMAKEKEDRSRGGDANGMKATNNFCITLSALVSDKDFKALKTQFLK